MLPFVYTTGNKLDKQQQEGVAIQTITWWVLSPHVLERNHIYEFIRQFIEHLIYSSQIIFFLFSSLFNLEVI